MNLIFFDTPQREHLLPLVFLKPVATLRIGIFKIYEKWQNLLKVSPQQCSFLSQEYLSKKFPTVFSTDNWYINGAILPNKTFIEKLIHLKEGEALFTGDTLLALKSKKHFSNYQLLHETAHWVYTKIKTEKPPILEHLWDIFLLNRSQIVSDFEWIVQHKKSQAITDPHTVIYGKENIFVEEGVKIKAAFLDASDLPIYLGKNSTVEMGAIIQGAFALSEGSTVNFGAKMRGDTTVGSFGKVGGEVKNVVFQDYSHKAHDGYLGNSVIGEWCNMGADTNCSNLKNNYAQVQLWNFVEEKYISTGQQLCGVIMGDHTKCGIGTMFNTGTVVGVAANIFGSQQPQKYVPSFSWGTGNNLSTHKLDIAIDLAKKLMSQKDQFSAFDAAIFKEVFVLTEKYRKRNEKANQ